MNQDLQGCVHETSRGSDVLQRLGWLGEAQSTTSQLGKHAAGNWYAKGLQVQRKAA